jgi:hypothetical protein
MLRDGMTQWTPLTGLKEYSRVLGRKIAFCAIAWVVVYFLTQPFRNPEAIFLPLFGLMVGALAGLVVGWYMATDSVEDSGMNGLPLWTILVLASCISIWGVEGILYLITGWSAGFGGWMLLTAASLLALAAAVWHASSQE